MEEHYPVENFLAIPGKGVKGTVQGREIEVMSPSYLEKRGYSIDNNELDKLSRQGKTIVFVLVDGILSIAVALADIIRHESKETISRLKEMDIKCLMITGDKKEVAEWVSKDVGLDQYFAEVLPRKSRKIKKYKKGGIVAMTGDGSMILRLWLADVGIAIGAGTDIALKR